MPWKETDVVSERMRFVVRLERGETMSALCREFGISRKTGYKILRRYEEGGPKRCTTAAESLITAPIEWRRSSRHASPGFERNTLDGAPRSSGVSTATRDRGPLASDEHVWQILKRHDLVVGRKRRRRTPLYSDKLRKTEASNQVWCADYKGQFRLGNQRYCYPLTVTDHYSRYLLGCEALEHTRGDSAKTVFASLFARHGLPEAIRTDNGAPFASTGLWGLTPLSAWWIGLGIVHERIEPATPSKTGPTSGCIARSKPKRLGPQVARCCNNKSALTFFRTSTTKSGLTRRST